MPEHDPTSLVSRQLPMSLDDTIARINSQIFIREFTYKSTLFTGTDRQERELCDGAVWVGDLLILLQNKERNDAHVTGEPDAEAKWFNKKVSKLAVDQLHDSVQHLEKEQSLPLANLRGQTIDLTKTKERVSLTHLIALYAPSAALPADLVMKKGRMSRRVGYVHFLTVGDYVNVCNTLHTPFEVSDYLTFRQGIARKNPGADTVSEKALLGQYLFDPDLAGPVSPSNEEYVDRLINDTHEFSLASMLTVYLDRTTFGGDDTAYHTILIELAKLRRNMAHEFRKRFAWAMDVCKQAINHAPSRFYVPSLGCPFIFIPLNATRRDDWSNHLLPMTHLCKHDLKSPKCLGVTIAPDPHDPQFYLVNWAYIEFPWEPDEKADTLIRDLKPFRESAEKMIPTYSFDP
jgi:hypothetical protein